MANKVEYYVNWSGQDFGVRADWSDGESEIESGELYCTDEDWSVYEWVWSPTCWLVSDFKSDPEAALFYLAGESEGQKAVDRESEIRENISRSVKRQKANRGFSAPADCTKLREVN